METEVVGKDTKHEDTEEWQGHRHKGAEQLEGKCGVTHAAPHRLLAVPLVAVRRQASSRCGRAWPAKSSAA
eukprot:2234373-Prymnesium_polylepis.1